jgi:hypothetical protein
VEPVLRTRDDVSAGIRVGWELLHLLQLSVRSLEDTATRVVAAQVAGLIALWTQLFTFEEAVPQSLVWAAWAVLIVSICLLGFRISPRRLSSFWRRLDRGWGTRDPDDPLDEADEAAIVEELTAALRAQRDRLQRAIRLSIALGLAGLALAAIAYVVDKAFYAG